MVLILTLVAAITVLAASSFGRSAADQTFDRLLKGAALQIAERVHVANGEPEVDLPVSAFELLSLARSDRVFYRILGPSGKTLTGYEGLPLPKRPSGEGEQVYETSFKGTAVRAVLLSRQLAEESVSGRLQVIVAQTTRERAALADTITARAALSIIGAGAAFVLLALLALRLALRPLERIERLILARDSHDLAPLDIEVPREVRALVTAINRFMGRLDRRISSMQDFVADAAHQMRTPITALRAQAQLALGETDEKRLAQLHRRIHQRSVGLGRLADQLLSRALISHRADAAPHSQLDLRRVALDAERETRISGEDGRDPVTLELPDDPVLVTGDFFSLKEAAKNLLNNAFLHGRPPVILFVEARPDGACVLGVQDHGPGLPHGVREKLGTRFSKSEITPQSAGLGLAIVVAVATTHGGRVIFDGRPGQGTGICLSLPCPMEPTR